MLVCDAPVTMAVVTVAVVTVAVGPAYRQRADDSLSCALPSGLLAWTFQPCWSVCVRPPVCKSQVTAQPTVAVAARYVRAWLESLCGSLLAWESAAGPCHTIISKAELTGRAAPSDLLGAPFNYITMAVMATVRCRPPGASQRFRAVLVRLRAARASGGFCAARRGARQRGPRALRFRARSQGWVSLCLYRGTRSHADIPRACDLRGSLSFAQSGRCCWLATMRSQPTA